MILLCQALFMWKMMASCVCVCVCVLVAQLHLTLYHPWTVAHQAPLSMGFSRQEYWSGLPFPSPGDLLNPGLGLGLGLDRTQSPALQTVSLSSEPPEKPSGFLVFYISQIKHLAKQH